MPIRILGNIFHDTLGLIAVWNVLCSLSFPSTANHTVEINRGNVEAHGCFYFNPLISSETPVTPTGRAMTPRNTLALPWSHIHLLTFSPTHNADIIEHEQYFYFNKTRRIFYVIYVFQKKNPFQTRTRQGSKKISYKTFRSEHARQVLSRRTSVLNKIFVDKKTKMWRNELKRARADRDVKCELRIFNELLKEKNCNIFWKLYNTLFAVLLEFLCCNCTLCYQLLLNYIFSNTILYINIHRWKIFKLKFGDIITQGIVFLTIKLGEKSIFSKYF